MVHLHTHTMFSLRDSIIRPEDLIARLKEIGQDTVAITDHGGSLGGVTLYQSLKAEGIRYIHGCEFYICGDVSVKDKDSKYYHLVALCKNETGRRNLNKLISISERPENRYFKPRIDFDLLSAYGEGLVILSACLAGEISKFILAGDMDQARQTAIHYRARFGEDYFLEVQSHNDPMQIAVNREIVRLAKQLGIPCVVTTDAHYTWEEDRKYQSKYAFNGSYKEDGEAYIDCFVQSEQEVRDRLTYLDSETVDELIANTHLIADRCRMEIPLSPPIMPKVDTPPQFKSNHDWLVSLCRDGFQKKLNIDLDSAAPADPNRPQLTKEQIDAYISRYQYELNALDKMGFVDYILLVYSYASVGRRRGIARGSGGGSLINYITNITDIDPIEHGLYFERFIDVSALSKLESGEITAKELKIPDIDLDFSKESCDMVMKFLYEKYGEDKVASIGKFGTNQTKGTIRDMCKVLNIGLDEADRIAKSFGEYEIDEIDRMISGELSAPESIKEAISYTKCYPELFEYVRKLNGLPKSFGLHACGKVVATRELDCFLPSCYDSNGIRYLQGDMHDVEDMGLVKIDVLGLRTLDAEYDTLEQSGESKEFLDPKQDYSDDKVLDIFRKGDTVGIFQMSSPGMKKTLKNMNVGGINDLSAANALFRPGSLQYIDNYCRRKAGQEQFEYLHPDLEPILKNTYGIIVFQEQLIEIGRMAGLHNPDQLRKATGKKNPKLLAEVEPELHEKLLARGWSEAQFSKLWSDMLEFARYSFNKCVAGSTRIKRAGQGDKWWPTVDEMWNIKNDLTYAKNAEKLPLRSKYLRNYGSALSMFPDRRIRKNKIVDIYQSGVRDVWTVTTESGASLTCTENHRFPTQNGYRELSELCVGDKLFVIGPYEKTKIKYNFTNGKFKKNTPLPGEKGFQHIEDGESVKYFSVRNTKTSNRTPCERCGKQYTSEGRFELHHIDRDRTNNEQNNLIWVCNSCHKKMEYEAGRRKVYEKGLPSVLSPVVSIEYAGQQMTYDIEMADPAHNFITDTGLVTANSHSSAYAIIAYMTAKQKAYYPAEFYCGLCNSYIGKSDFVKNEAAEIVGDMMKHRVRIGPANFRNDHRRCNVKDGQVLWGIPLIRDCNIALGEELYALRDIDQPHFWRVAKILWDKGMKSKVEILVKLGFFREYGTAKELLRVLEFAELFKMGDRKSIKRSAVAGSRFMEETLQKYASSANAKGKELTTFKILDCGAILDECEDYIKTLDLGEFDDRSMILTQREYLGALVMPTGKGSDRRRLFVNAVFPLNRKSDGKLFGYNMHYTSIGSGVSNSMTIFSERFNKTPISSGDIVLCKDLIKDKKGYFRMLDYEKCY